MPASRLLLSPLKIIEPEIPRYSIVSLVIIAVAVVVKIILGRYVKSKGKQVNSGSLVASGSDAMFDAILSGGAYPDYDIQIVPDVDVSD